MTKQYNVVWLDDECDTPAMVQIAIEAEYQDIHLRGFSSFKAGFDYLESNIKEVDAVLLDAMFFVTPDQVAGTEVEDLSAFIRARDRLIQLSPQRELPWFVLTGQSQLESNGTFLKLADRLHRKTSEADRRALWQKIKEKADQQPLTQLRHRYADAFAACTREYVGEEARRHLLDVLRFLHEPPAGDNGHKYLNSLRQVVEAIFYAAHGRGLLADECVPKGKVNMHYAADFLRGKKVGPFDHKGKPTGIARTVKPSEACFPTVLADDIEDILKLFSTGSHAKAAPGPVADADRLRQTQLYVRTPYRLASLTYKLLDVLIWFRGYADAHPDVATNRATWVYLDAETAPSTATADKFKTGCVSFISTDPTRGHGFFLEDGKTDLASRRLIHASTIREYGLKEGDLIRVSFDEHSKNGSPPPVKTVERIVK